MSLLKKSLLVVSAIALMSGSALADFPDRKVQVVYPWAAGTPTYGVSQLIAEAMSKQLGQAMPVVAKPGANGVLAMKSFLDEPADGYTIMDGYVAPLVISPIFGKADWTCADFTPLYAATANGFAIAMRPDETRWSDFPSFIEYLKANPAKTAYNGSGTSLPHLIAASVMQKMDTVSRAVPYDDLALGVKDLRNGILDWIIINPGVYEANKDQLKVLMTLSDTEDASETYGGAPRPSDFGLDIGVTGLAPAGWDWWLVRSDTPADRVEVLRNAMKSAMADPEVLKSIRAVGFQPLGYAPDEYLQTCDSVRSQLESGVKAVEWETKAIRAAN